ncbi:MAG: right-handed parallel beta-helix repeat-containing protein [Candidatus Bathyarchaeia archaeon]
MNNLKSQILPILLIFTLATASAFTLGIPTVKAASVLEVPSASYPTIQSALNAAEDGDTIKIAAGTYNENINYDGYAQTVANGAAQPKSGITLQGSNGTIINGAVSLFYLKNLKIASLTVTGDLALGDGKAYGYVSGSVVSNVQVGLVLSVGGPGNTVVDSSVKLLILKGGNTKTEFPAYNTKIENNYIQGVTIQAGSHSNTIKGNVISNGQTGIYEEPSKTYYTTGNNQIINNTITNNEVGIFLFCSTGDNGATSHNADTIIQNMIKENAVGLEFSASTQYVYGNTIYNNDFVGNDVQTKINNLVTNTWDDGLGKGNYWSDYTGKDANGDGVGDSPYKINAQNQDNYPLIKPWSVLTSTTPTTLPSPASQVPTLSDTTPLATAPESTPFFTVAGLMVVSVLALIFLKRKLAAL